jgi:hypothetical protein
VGGSGPETLPQANELQSGLNDTGQWAQALATLDLPAVLGDSGWKPLQIQTSGPLPIVFSVSGRVETIVTDPVRP